MSRGLSHPSLKSFCFTGEMKRRRDYYVDKPGGKRRILSSDSVTCSRITLYAICSRCLCPRYTFLCKLLRTAPQDTRWLPHALKCNRNLWVTVTRNVFVTLHTIGYIESRGQNYTNCCGVGRRTLLFLATLMGALKWVVRCV